MTRTRRSAAGRMGGYEFPGFRIEGVPLKAHPTRAAIVEDLLHGETPVSTPIELGLEQVADQGSGYAAELSL
jgi:hypothetical protein